MKDERIEQAKNKIRSEMAMIVFIGVVFSFLVKTLILNMSLEECITEYVIMIFFPLYQFIRMHILKVSVYSKSKQSIRNLVITILVLVVISAVVILNSMQESPVYDWQNSVVGVSSFLALFIGIFGVANRYNRYKGHKYEQEFDDDK
ncbi:DUF6773 family protein [Desulfosporosinus hippei]|uniref:Uncharacterized protein n=1 Tax=Desulfosporosinus hippei DSM 8344 TaxID=1121419 RepID=A0A1G8BIB7_9FIRM|nr:DUF6773 family protein [Desulfosporosinus hippei]SDH32881.1 hypothetical protein SAMN05443529_11242 [Desulfosporosinus hippei DSM 8344]